MIIVNYSDRIGVRVTVRVNVWFRFGSGVRHSNMIFGTRP